PTAQSLPPQLAPQAPVRVEPLGGYTCGLRHTSARPCLPPRPTMLAPASPSELATRLLRTALLARHRALRCSRRRRLRNSRVILFAEPVHANQVGRTDRSRRRAGHDDNEIARLVTVHRQ